MINDNEEDAILKEEVGDTNALAEQILDEDFKKKFKTLDAQRHVFKSRAEKEKEARLKLEEENKKLKEEKLAATPAPKQEPSPASPKQEGLSVRDFLELKKTGLSDVELAEVVSQAEALQVPIAKFVGSELFQPWIEKKREVAKSAQNTPSPSFSSATVKGKTYETMSDKERGQNFPEILEQMRRGDR